MSRRVIANVQDFDMENLFNPRPLLEEMEEAGTGALEVLPKKTLREKNYGPQPLMIRPDYSGDFLKKLDQPQEGKLVEVEGADEENLKDFTMPSEMLKHQEKPHPRVNLDEWYDFNRPGDQAGGEDLKQYWDRGWDNNDSPEISEDKWLRMWTIPGESNRMARNVVASFLSSNERAGRVVTGFLIEQAPPVRVKIAKLMSELIKSKIHGKKEIDKGGVTARIIKAAPAIGLWVFQTDSAGPAPKGFKKPYTTTFQFKRRGTETDPNKLDVYVNCTCPSWVLWGAQYHAVMEDYLYGKIRPVFAPPRKRDHEGSFLACKHVLKCIELVSRARLGALPKELKKRVHLLMKRPQKFEFEEGPEETIKIPKDLIGVGRRPKMKRIMEDWEKDPKRRKNLVMSLTDPDEVAFLAFKYPSTATTYVAERLKQLPQKKAERLLEEVEALTGEEVVKERALPPELKGFDLDAGLQSKIKDLDKKSNTYKVELVRGLTNPDLIAYLTFKFDHDLELRSQVTRKLHDIILKSKDPEEKKKADHWFRFIIGG